MNPMEVQSSAMQFRFVGNSHVGKYATEITAGYPMSTI